MLAYSWITLFITFLKFVSVKVVKFIFIVCGTVIAYYHVASNRKQ